METRKFTYTRPGSDSKPARDVTVVYSIEPSRTYSWGIVTPGADGWCARAWCKTRKAAHDIAGRRFTWYAIARMERFPSNGRAS